ncbi:hypothetical protein ACVWXO_000868 [Bradyrhizobium sp. LM2.7]
MTLFWKAISPASLAGEDDLEMRYGKELGFRSASPCARAKPSHFGQCR